RERLPAAHPLLVLEETFDHDAGDEALRAVVEAVDVHHGHLVRLPIDPVRARVLSLATPDQVAHPVSRGVEAPDEGGDRRVGEPAAPRGALVLHLAADQLAESLEVVDRIAA